MFAKQAGWLHISSYRLTDMDCAHARMQEAVGVSAIQLLWRYDRPLDTAAIEKFHDALVHGRLARVVARATVAAAGDRWTSDARFAPLLIDPEPVATDALMDWIDARGSADLAAYGGPAWRLTATALDDGGAIVSLLVSHAISDALGIVQAVVDAAAGKSVDLDYASDDFGQGRLLAEDAAAAARQFARVAALRREHRGAAQPSNSEPDPVVDAPEPSELPGDFRVPRAIAVVPTHEWHAAAAARGGTATTLGVGVAAGLAALAGRTTVDGVAYIGMPVSVRSGPTDLRANAVRGIRFALDTATLHDGDLTGLRATVKSELQASAVGVDPEELAVATNVTTPLSRLAQTWSNTAPDHVSTVCSVIRNIDPAVLRIDGTEAAAMSIGLVNRGIEDPSRLARFGGNLRTTVVDVGEFVVVRASGFHADTLRTRADLNASVAAVLQNYGLNATFW